MFVVALQNELHDSATQDISFRANKEYIAEAKSGYIRFYEKVESNSGNWLNKETGIFTAPYAGTYLFSVQTFTVYTDNAEIRLNGSWKNTRLVFTHQDESCFVICL